MVKNSAMTRREFIKKGLTLVAVSGTAPSFLTKTALAMSNPWDQKRTAQSNGKDDRVLVVVQMGGGNDGLNSVVPYADDQYYRKRPNLAIPRNQVLRLNDELGFHANLKGFKELYDRGRMALTLGVGYPNPDRSHFRAMEIWNTGDPTGRSQPTGWIGKIFDSQCPDCATAVGLNLGDNMPLALQNERGVGLVFASPDQFQWLGTKEQLELYKILNTPASANNEETVDFLRHTAMNAQLSSDQIRDASAKYRSSVAYPQNSRFGNSLKLIAQLIAGQMPTRVYYAHIGGFDTHGGQKGVHDRLLGELSTGIAAFYQDLDQQGNADRVLTVAFSEFGRRVSENASDGTDHGTAAPMFLFGGGVKPGIYGRQPNLTDLDQGDLKYNVDFRAVYATIIDLWMRADSKKVLGARFDPLPFLA